MNQYLPTPFLQRMEQFLGPEFPAFLASYQEAPHSGLRVNTLKISPSQFLRLSPFSLTPIPWAPEGFRYPSHQRPGKHPYHAAGLYYLQEPSAMAPAPVLNPQPGERVLDLCAAPGGKATQLAQYLKGQGVLVANEIHGARVKILMENLERLGVTNAVVANETPARLAERFPAYFDCILVDAPCSGEGMFRKDPEACSQWTLEGVLGCAQRQREILETATRMLRAGGRLVYSTCTFAPEENEGVLEGFLREHPEFTIEEIPLHPGFALGQPQWINASPLLSRTCRLFPHRLEGEGHFLALLRKLDGPPSPDLKEQRKKSPQGLEYYRDFCRENLTAIPEGSFLTYGNHLYLVPPGLPDLTGLRVPRPGWPLGEIKKGRFEPSHALALALAREQFQRIVTLSPEDPRLLAYLRGETLDRPGDKGWTAVAVNDFPLGWGKRVGITVKNHYPKGLRWS